MARALVEKLHTYTIKPFDYATISDPEIADRARNAAERIRDLQRGAIIEIGRELIKVKADLEYGMFNAWVESSGMNRRTASNYMAAADAFGDTWESVSHLPANVIYRLASSKTPPEVRDAVLQLKPGQGMGLADIDHAVSEAQKTRDRKERASKEYKEARAAELARFDAAEEKRQIERGKERTRAAEVAEKTRFMLGGYFSELCDLMKGVDTYMFAQELEKLAEAYRKNTLSKIQDIELIEQ